MININVGVLGHVDSGKTSICRAISTTSSTAAFDASPQSKERGITLDLGFSSFQAEGKYNFTLVDCPGHSDLIRTVIGGAQIMDIVLLVIDITKGMQPQTAECLVLAQLTSLHLIVALNKVDEIPLERRENQTKKMRNLTQTALKKTKFGGSPVVAISTTDNNIGTNELLQAVLLIARENMFVRDVNSPFLMAVDHCFSIKGQGTVVTGTVLQGIVRINDMIEFPSLKEEKKVKSMQSFHVAVEEAKAGDRVGICFPGLDPNLIERTVISSPKLVHSAVRAGIISLQRIAFFKKPIVSQRKYQVTIGYYTVNARVVLFHGPKSLSTFDMTQDYKYVDQLDVKDSSAADPEAGGILALVEFDRAAIVTPNATVIGSDLQSNDETGCRLAFSGRILEFTEDKLYKDNFLPGIRIYRDKVKEGKIDRVQSDSVLIVKNFCKKESKIDHLLNLKVNVHLPDETSVRLLLTGRIESRFGQTIKVRVALDTPMTADQKEVLLANLSKCSVALNYKRYLFNHVKGKLFQ